MRTASITKIVNGYTLTTGYEYGIESLTTFHPDMPSLIKHMTTIWGNNAKATS